MTHYTTYLHTHGHLIVAPTGMPLGEMARLTGNYGKRAVMHPGIAHHFHISEHRDASVFAICHTPTSAEQWQNEIIEKIADMPLAFQWLYGIDTGTSSLTIFAALSKLHQDFLQGYLDRPQTPSDASDLGRCIRLCDKLDWHDRIPELADLFPTSHWPAIAARWQELRNAIPTTATEILRAIHAQPA